MVRRFFWHKIGDGKTTSLWFDRWCANGPLIDEVSVRDIYGAGLTTSSKVADAINSGTWMWPSDWAGKYPTTFHTNVPHLNMSSQDTLWWRDNQGVFKAFSVGTIWEDIRPRGIEAVWTNVVWYPHCIPRHAFHLWLVMQRKLKTQDLLKQWDVGDNTNLNLFQCPLCELEPDSHEHLFFECLFAREVWSSVLSRCELCIPTTLEGITYWLIPIARKHSVTSILGKLVFAASSYFIWQERNARLFKKVKRSKDQVVEIILSTIRLKLITFRFKKTCRVDRLIDLWNLPRHNVKN